MIPPQNIGRTFSEYLREKLRTDPEFKVAYQCASMLHEWGDIARKTRLQVGLSQSELAQRAGTTQPWLSKFENAETVRLDLSNVHRVLNALNLELVIQPRKRARNTSRTGARTRTA